MPETTNPRPRCRLDGMTCGCDPNRTVPLDKIPCSLFRSLPETRQAEILDNLYSNRDPLTGKEKHVSRG